MAEQISYESLAPGTEFGERYSLLRILGKGGFGKVFLADDLTLEIRVALKVLNPALAHDEKQLKRFRREVVVARKISHKNVCKLYDIGQVGSLAYLTMEYIDGRDLYGMLEKHRAFPLRAGLDICYQIGSALEAAHREGVVHRDLKPHNVIIDREGAAKILDFGIARSMDLEGVTATGMMMGTPTYMSPEQARGEPGDPRSDLYSFGVLMYQLFTGAAPFTAETPLGVLFQHVQQAPRPPVQLNPELPAEINDLILKCLAKDAAQRYQHAREISEDVDRYFKSQGWTLGIPAADRDRLFTEFAPTPSRGDSPPKQGRSPVPKERAAAPPPKIPVPRPQEPPEPTAPTVAVDSSTPARPDTSPELRAERRPAPAAEAPTVETPSSQPVAAARPELTPTAPKLEQKPAAPRPEQTPAGRRARPAARMATPVAPQPVPAAEPTAKKEAPTTLTFEPTAIMPAPAVLAPAAARTEEIEPARSFETEEASPRSGRLLLVALVGVSVALGITTALVGPRLWGQLSRPAPIRTPRPEATAAPVPGKTPPRIAETKPTQLPPSPTLPAAEPELPGIVAPPQPVAEPPTATPGPTEPPTPVPTEAAMPVPTEPPTATPEPPTATPEPTEPPPPPPTESQAQRTTPTPLPTRKPAKPTTPPAPTATLPPSPTPRPALPTPTTPPAVELVDNIILGGVPADAEICIDGNPTKGSKQGLSFILGGIAAGPHDFSFTSKQKGSARKTVEILGGGQRNSAIKLQDADWKAPRYRVTLRAGAEKIELEKQVDGLDEVKLQSGETIVVELSLQEAKLTIRRADGREHEKFCPWQERAACGPLPLLGCGTVPVPQ